MTMENTAEAAPMIGHNLDPFDIDQIQELLGLDEDIAERMKGNATLLDEAREFPKEIENDEVCGKIQEHIKELTVGSSTTEKFRVVAKAPYLNGGKAVDGFFNTSKDKLEKAKDVLNARVTVYLRKKREEEDRRRREEERLAREEAERARIAAEEAAAAMEDEAQMEAAIAADNEARQREADAAQRFREASMNAAEMSRTRSSGGTVASLRTKWVHDEATVNFASIDLEELRSHLPEKAIHQAIRSFIDKGGRKLEGVRIYEDTKAVVR